MGSIFFTSPTTNDLSKKHDDPPRRASTILSPSSTTLPTWHPALPSTKQVSPRRKTLKRLLIASLFLSVIYIFVRNVPSDLGAQDRRRPYFGNPDDPTPRDRFGRPQKPRPAADSGQRAPPPSSPPSLASAPPPSTSEDIIEPLQDDTFTQHNPDTDLNDGPLHFPYLSATLQATAATGDGQYGRNILFVATSLVSAARLLPIACSMGIEQRNRVHFVMLGGQSDMSMQMLQEINGVDESCHVAVHDGRLDDVMRSTQGRTERGVRWAVQVVHGYMHPHAVLVDQSDAEEGHGYDDGMLRIFKEEAEGHGEVLIAIPHRNTEKMGWVTKLDSMSLSAWRRTSVEIVIQAHAGASGNLLRLLRSLEKADYTGLTVPRLTIELPDVLDEPTATYLESFQWPPKGVPNPQRFKGLSLRRYMAKPKVDDELATTTFLESFWPAEMKNSHVLVLSPQVEVAPNYCHYVMYSLLEYRYSKTALDLQWDNRLFSISLDLPTTQIGGVSPLVVPNITDFSESTRPAPSFLWGAPNSNAALISGRKWVELHGFAAQSLRAQKMPDQPTLVEKLVSERYPAWLELALRLCRLRGYMTLYPGPATVASLAMVHHDLPQALEEYAAKADELAAESDTLTSFAHGPLLASLPDGGVLTPFSTLPIMKWDGAAVVSMEALDASAAEYAVTFKRDIGRCKVTAQKRPELMAGDLFCLDGEETHETVPAG